MDLDDVEDLVTMMYSSEALIEGLSYSDDSFKRKTKLLTIDTVDSICKKDVMYCRREADRAISSYYASLSYYYLNDIEKRQSRYE